MIAGGTGITPFYQLIQHVFKQTPEAGEKIPELTLIFANRTTGDILLKEELEALANTHKGLTVLFSVDRLEEGEEWGGNVGFVDKDYLEEHVGAPGEKKLVFFCGPMPMNEFVGKALIEIGHSETNVVRY